MLASCLQLQFDILLFSGESSSEKVTAATVGVSALSNAKTSFAADPLTTLAKQLGGSKRNALLRWCQNRTATYTVAMLAEKSSEVIAAVLLLFSSTILNWKVPSRAHTPHQS